MPLIPGNSPHQIPTNDQLGAQLDAQQLVRFRLRQEFSLRGTGASETVTIRRPYLFEFAIVDSVGTTSLMLPNGNADGSFSADTPYLLTFTTPVGNLLTYSITPIIQ
ncbi:hypothetical protein GCM10027275_50530 [Rhabdobacter roseus]|uniref:Uncharacterized protein n=1 Tax=Rhabdobacter roseus TaxID=1655419 RepID=A0A840TRZ5_9BACT|nr:hypothetical protein [Rhabdobacter roseus]MBB5287126.1 hypothetical protein [Rhabdobacter roseus]